MGKASPHLLTAKNHPASYLSFQLWESKITMGPFTMLAKWTGILDQFFKNVCHIIYLLLW